MTLVPGLHRCARRRLLGRLARLHNLQILQGKVSSWRHRSVVGSLLQNQKSPTAESYTSQNKSPLRPHKALVETWNLKSRFSLRPALSVYSTLHVTATSPRKCIRPVRRAWKQACRNKSVTKGFGQLKEAKPQSCAIARGWA